MKNSPYTHMALAVIATLAVTVSWPLAIAILALTFFIARHRAGARADANSSPDVLRALVKALETRDPYTSGHSLRVAYLAQRIAHALGLSATEVDNIERAALLHDIGKIEAIYAGILAKRHALSPDERLVIQSHPVKGEQILRQLTSIPEDVIACVRAHHERPDGTGYPDGLCGSEIPVGARIIGVCDAIDAMLSDRPYRSAMDAAAVAAQLRANAGSQFDPLVVDAVLRSGLVQTYDDVLKRYAGAPEPAVEQPIEMELPTLAGARQGTVLRTVA